MVKYYLSYEALITVASLAFIVVIRREYRKRDGNFPKLNERKTFLTSALLLLFFILFNAVPDAVIHITQQHQVL